MTFVDHQASRTHAALTHVGDYTLRFKASDGARSGSDDLLVTVLPPASGAGVLAWTEDTVSVEEGDQLTLTVERGHGSTGAVSVACQVVADSAGDSDVTLIDADNLHWADGEDGERQITLLIRQDGIAENTEVCSLQLADISGGALASNDRLEVSIAANEGLSVTRRLSWRVRDGEATAIESQCCLEQEGVEVYRERAEEHSCDVLFAAPDTLLIIEPAEDG